MTEEQYIDEIFDAWPEDGITATAALTLAAEATSAYPGSAQLWRMRGDLLHLKLTDLTLTNLRSLAQEDNILLKDLPDKRLMRECYERSVSLDPSDAESLESLAYFYDIWDERPDLAEDAFRRAIQNGGSPSAYAGLARALAETGRKAEAIELLDACPFVDYDEALKMRSEIDAGEWDIKRQ